MSTFQGPTTASKIVNYNWLIVNFEPYHLHVDKGEMLRLELRGVLLCCKRSLASRVALRDALQLQASGEAEEVTVTVSLT